MANNNFRFKLEGGNWNSLNKMMNESTYLEGMLDDGAKKIYDTAKGVIDTTESTSAIWMYEALKIEVAEPTAEVGIKMRFISIPSIGFEMRFSPLKKGLDNVSS